MLEAGTIVRGNWSSLEHEVERCGSCSTRWWVYCKKGASFDYLGGRVDDEIMITDEGRPRDRLIVVKEPNRDGQLLLPL